MTQGKEKHKQKFKERGITLIALVITIIVLLILAGVALSALTGDSGILNNAESAKDKTNLANAKEQVALAAQGALTKGYAQGSGTITRDNLKNELDNIVGTGKYEIIQGKEPWIVEIEDYKALISSKGEIREPIINAKETTPWLPAGFSHVEGTDLSNGLTITKTNGDLKQNYVWIEVPTTEQIITLSDGTTKTIHLAGAKNEEEILETLELYAGKGTSTNYRTITYKDEWYDRTGKTKDTEGANLEDSTGCGMTYSEYQTAYSSMLNSIKKYGGFWLAQYEAGISYEQGNRTSSASRITNPTSANYAKDQYPYNFVYCSEAQKIANADSTDKYTSSLPFGIQWDLVCKFLEVKTNLNYKDIARDSRWGNYHNVGWTSSTDSRYSEDDGNTFKTESKTKSSGSYLLTTGAIDEITLDGTEYIANPMNIYDFAGNVWEWTLEYTAYTAGPCALRGGHYTRNSNDVKAASRFDPRDSIWVPRNYGFRSTLY